MTNVNLRTKKQFQIIFQEAHVVDLDFSKWDKYVRLVVVGQMFPVDASERFPLFNVDFCAVSEVRWKANHLGIKLKSPRHHSQWTIIQFNLKKGRRGYDIELSGFGGPSPELHFICKDIQISPLDNTIVDIINPAWNRPYGPLARPDLEQLYRLYKRKRGLSQSGGRIRRLKA